jgi:hypothetical protein
MRVPPDILKCVVFIGRTVGGVPRFEGTGFLVGLDSRADSRVMFPYLVTAKHVASVVEGDFWVRMNKKDGTSVQVDASNQRWTYHPSDPSADVAVMSWGMPDDLDHRAIPLPMMLEWPSNLEAEGIGVGDEVFLSGLFASAYGRAKNSPIIRKGNLAMIPADKIRTRDMGPIDAYLIETHSFGGLSGSPVFARETIVMKVNKPPRLVGQQPKLIDVHAAGGFYLIGLAHGHYEIDERDINAPAVRPAGDERRVNLGIAIVVPAGKVMDVINSAPFVKGREELERILESHQATPTPDSLSAQGDRDESTTGPEPERLAIDLPMDEAVRKMFEAGKPPKD